MPEDRHERLEEATRAGGLTERELEDYLSTDISTYSTWSEAVTELCKELPLAVSRLEKSSWEDELYDRAFEDAEQFASFLSGRLRDRFRTNTKKNEYAMRSIYTLSESLNQDQTDDMVNAVLYEEDNAAAVVAAQYIGEIEEIADEEVLERAYNVIQGHKAAERLATANLPVEKLPDSIERREYKDFEAREVRDDDVVTRIRGMKTAGGCPLLEKGHIDTSLDGESEYHGKNMLITVEGEPVGSVKGIGNQSMMALQNIKADGKILMEKGWAYEVSYRVLNQREKNVPSVPEQGWNTLEVDRLEVMPIRPLGAKGDTSPEEFCRDIDEMMGQIELE